MFVAAAMLTLAADTSQIVPQQLRCESLVNPVVIERRTPDFSWKLRPAQPGLRNLRQTAYQLIVASDASRLARGVGDLWDSGQVNSSNTYAVTYGGKPLGSRLNCWWSVRVWDQEGRPSGWSAPASFGTGLDRSDWKAKWIGGHRVEPDSAFHEAGWMWANDGAFGQSPAAKHTFVRNFEIDPLELKSAVLHITADDQFSVEVNGKWAGASDGRTDAWKRPQAIAILGFLRPGSNVIRIHAENGSLGYAGVLAALLVEGKDGGSGTFIQTPTNWQVEGANIVSLGGYTMAPWGTLRPTDSPRAEYFRRSFQVDGDIQRAILYVTAKGLVDPYLNGERVSDELFTPGWTDYEHRIEYKAFDLTSRLQNGENVLGAILGDGWYAGSIGWLAQRYHYGSDIGILAQLEVTYTDGRRQTVASDHTWQNGEGGVRQQDFLMGEVFDARLEPKGWSSAGFAADDWRVPVEQPAFPHAIQAFTSNPVREYRALSPVQIKEIASGVYVADFGQNLAGFCHLRLEEPSGQSVTIRHGETLNPDGTLYTANLRLARATDVYISDGQRSEWTPRFTFHGFRYVEVTGLSAGLKPEMIEAVAISSDTPEVRHFATSDPMINQLASNAWWTQKMNFIDVPTDCPQRDERLGWTGDAQAYIRTAALYSDVQPFFNRWLVALDDGQRADGNYPTVAPLKVSGDDGGPAWADAGVICPWQVYEIYGDKRQLAASYPGMKRFVEFCRARSGDDYLPPDDFHCFGDWLSINANTPKEVIYQAYFIGSTQILADSAELLGRNDEAASYRDLAAKLKKAFIDAYVSSDGRVKGDTQCGYVLALGFDILDEAGAKKAADNLVADIEGRGWHLSTGFVGTRDLMYVLSKIGRNDVAFRLLHNKTFPSWGFEIENGATTIWERWDGWTPERGFQDVGMNSFAHYAYGAVMGWVFETVGGITPLEPGFGRIRIAPQFDPHLTWADTSYDSIRGSIRCRWERIGDTVNVEVEVPPNVEAVIEIGAEKQTVGSGHHTFTAMVPKMRLP
ncbi:MAG: family 78 glycoside hydrolase catalytic domain [Fimbriimonadaceae bacterium]|nr:family 78 glycoside hydrolase catalytic domain [Fimbriimonadaceae bacterium]